MRGAAMPDAAVPGTPASAAESTSWSRASLAPASTRASRCSQNVAWDVKSDSVRENCGETIGCACSGSVTSAGGKNPPLDTPK
jgi:hypothetical protein